MSDAGETLATRFDELSRQFKALGDRIPHMLEDQLRGLRRDLPPPIDKSDAARTLQTIATEVSSLKAQVQALATRPDLLPDLKDQVTKANQKLEGLEKRIPPLSTMIAAAIAIAGILGLSWSDVRESSRSVTDLGSRVQAAVATLDGAKQDLASTGKSLVDDSKELKGRLESIVSKSQERVEEFEQRVTSLIGGIQGAEAQAARLTDAVTTALGSVAMVNEQLAKAAGSRELDGLRDSSTGEASMLALIEELGSALPAEIRLLSQARAAINEGQYARARALALRAKAADADRTSAVYDGMIGQSFFREKRYREAIGFFESGLLREPEQDTILNNLGAVYFALSQDESDEKKRQEYLEKSISYQRRSIASEPSDPVPYANISTGLNKLGRHEEALEQLDKYAGDENADILYQRGSTYAILNNKVAAIQALSRAFSLARSRALIALADDDLKSLRADEGFLTLLRTHLGNSIVAGAIASWKDDP